MLCLKFLFLYCASLITGWLGIHSLLVGLAHWDDNGALAPAAAGTLAVLIAAALITATVRMCSLSKNSRDQLL
ncbi:MAG: hypothetical protein LBV79_05130 [Candidatus Adiutrix sp.]|nr:hypothetical protein [Candidatus Adiutrix sp.]